MAAKRLPTLILLVLMMACAKPSSLDYIGINKIDIVNWGFPNSELEIELQFFNPNRQNFQLKETDIELHLNDIYLGRAILDSVIFVPKLDSVDIPLKMSVSTLGAASNIIRGLQDSSFRVRLNGNTKLGKSGIFINYPVKYEGLWSRSKLMNSAQ